MRVGEWGWGGPKLSSVTVGFFFCFCHSLPDELRQELPSGGALLQREVQLERGRRGDVALHHPHPDAVLRRLEEQVQLAAPQAARLRLGHGDDVGGDPLEEAAREQHLAAREVRPLGGAQLRLDAPGKGGNGDGEAIAGGFLAGGGGGRGGYVGGGGRDVLAVPICGQQRKSSSIQ